jgi:ribosomal protein L37AE/L43A
MPASRWTCLECKRTTRESALTSVPETHKSLSVPHVVVKMLRVAACPNCLSTALEEITPYAIS